MCIVIFCIQVRHCPFYYLLLSAFSPPKQKDKYGNVIPQNVDKHFYDSTESYYRNARSNLSVEMRTIVMLKLEFDFTLKQKNWSKSNWTCSLFRFEMGIKSSKEMLIWFRSVFLCMGFVTSRHQNSLLLLHAKIEFFLWSHWCDYPTVNIGRDQLFNWVFWPIMGCRIFVNSWSDPEIIRSIT